jgi:O-antigen ligase
MTAMKASEDLPSWLRASFVFFLASLLLGSAAMYVQIGIVFILTCIFFRWAGLKETVPRLLQCAKPMWWMLIGFAVIFSVSIFARHSISFLELGELKWILFLSIFSLFFVAVPFELRLSPMEKIAVGFLLLVLVYSLLDSFSQVTTGKGYGRHYLFGDELVYSKRGRGLLTNPIPFADVVGSFFCISALGAAASFSVKKKRLGVVMVTVALLSFICVLNSLSRGVWFAIGMTSLFSLFVLPKSFRKIYYLGIGIAGVIGLTTLLVSPMYLRRFLSAFSVEMRPNEIRLQLWHANWEMLKENPLGLGFNVNDSLLPSKLAELGYPESSFMSHPHNEFLDYAAATGWLGIALYLGVTIWFLVFSVKLLRKYTKSGNVGAGYLITSSILVQIFLNCCALTDQFTTPARFLICIAWAVPLALMTRGQNGDNKKLIVSSSQ